MTDSMAKSNNGAAVRGLLLVAVAVAVGVLLLRSSDDGTSAVAAGAEGGAAAPGVTQPLTPDTTAVPSPDTSAAVDDATTTETTAVAPTDTLEQVTTDTVDDTVETAPPVTGFEPRPAAEVTVQVANSTSTKGAAGAVTDELKTLSYITATPTNLLGSALERTRVHYQPGNLLEAQAVATVLGLDPKNDVFQMFQDTSAIDQWDEPDVLVALGNDLASG